MADLTLYAPLKNRYSSRDGLTNPMEDSYGRLKGDWKTNDIIEQSVLNRLTDDSIVPLASNISGYRDTKYNIIRFYTNITDTTNFRLDKTGNSIIAIESALGGPLGGNCWLLEKPDC